MFKHMISITAAVLTLSTPTFAKEASKTEMPTYTQCSEFPKHLFSGDDEAIIIARLESFRDLQCSVDERYSAERQKDVCDWSYRLLREIPNEPTQMLIAEIFDC